MTRTIFRVLHIDDDPTMTDLAVQSLSEYGIEVTALNEPTRAIELLLREQFQVVLLDVDMPSVSGIDLLDDIKRLHGGISVIMFTGIVALSTIVDSIRNGATACFFKPLENFAPLAELILAEFAKHERWRASLRELAQRQRQEACIPQIQATLIASH